MYWSGRAQSRWNGWVWLLVGLGLGAPSIPGQPGEPGAGAGVTLPSQPMTLAECLNVAFERNPAVRRSREELEAIHGVSVQTRAIVLPKLVASGDYSIREEDSVDRLEIPPIPGVPSGSFAGIDPGNQNWAVGIRLVQSVFEGGRMASSLRSARLLREQALAQHQVVLSDVTTEVRETYYHALLAAGEITVSEASVELLTREMEDSRRRVEAGTEPRFNLLRAEVELANARPRVSQARNAYRIARNVLLNKMGLDVPAGTGEEIPIDLADSLEVARLELGLSEALALALERRPELVAVRRAEALRQEGVRSARAGYWPRVEGYAGYGARKSNFSPDLDQELHGWEAGVHLGWNLFDGSLTHGRVIEAQARLRQTELDQEELRRQIELEVRSTRSTLVEAWEVLGSQAKVQEQAEEALRLARARAEAGTSTQLDVLSAQTALTDARTTQLRAKYAYAVARTRMERAIGAYPPVSVRGR
jgi:outer membrane protein